MSPDPSVHEDQLRTIERAHPPRRVWRRRLGCLFVLFLILAGAAWLGRDRLRAFFQPGSLEQLREKGDALTRMSPREMLQKMREETASLQQDWENLTDSGKIEERIQALRNDLATKREEVSGSARQAWEDIIQRSESLLEKARTQKERLPKVELDALREKMEEMESRFGDILGSKKDDREAPPPDGEENLSE